MHKSKVWGTKGLQKHLFGDKQTFLTILTWVEISAFCVPKRLMLNIYIDWMGENVSWISNMSDTTLFGAWIVLDENAASLCQTILMNLKGRVLVICCWYLSSTANRTTLLSFVLLKMSIDWNSVWLGPSHYVCSLFIEPGLHTNTKHGQLKVHKEQFAELYN